MVSLRKRKGTWENNPSSFKLFERLILMHVHSLLNSSKTVSDNNAGICKPVCI